MWYPSPQQQQHQQCSHRYVPSTTHQHADMRTSYYYRTSDDSSTMSRTNLPVPYPMPKHQSNETLVYYQPTTHVENINEISRSNESYADEMSSRSFPANCNPIIAAPRKHSVINNDQGKTSSTSACWDWLLYSPILDSNLYIPSSSFIPSIKQDDGVDDHFDFLASLPNWLLAMLYPSNFTLMDDEHDQEIHALHQIYSDEPFSSSSILNGENVSSSPHLSSERSQSQAISDEQHRSSTPDTDDGYQSASDASRSDCSHHHHPSSSLPSKVNVPSSSSSMARRITYAAAAVKPISTTTTTTTNDSSVSNHSQKSKFIAPRFERMHHAKQYLSSSSTQQRPAIRSNSNHVQRQPMMVQSNRRR